MEKKKNVYFIIPSMYGGGAERILTLVLNYLDRQRFNPTLVLFKKKGEYLESVPPYVEIVDLGKKSRWDVLKLIFKLRKVIKDGQPDVLVSFLDYTNIITMLAVLFLKHKPVVILSEHSNHRMYLPHTRFGFLRKILMGLTYRRASCVIAVSEGIRDVLKEDFKIDVARIAVIYNPIDTKNIRISKEEKMDHRFFNDPARPPVIISVGRLEKQKNFELLIKAFAAMKKKKDVRLIIVGQGRSREELERLAGRLGVDGYVDFVGFQRNPFAWMGRSDLFVLSSRWEGFGNVIIEAMACGVPVIATDCPVGPGEIIINGKNGILVRPDDLDAMTAAIYEMLDDGPLRNTIKEEALRYAERFDVMNVIPKYEKLIEDAKQL